MDFKEYAGIVKKRLLLIVCCMVIATVTAAFFSSMNYIPLYQASTKLIVNKTMQQDQFGKEQMDLGAISINMTLINTYTEIMKSPAIMDKVVQWHPDLELSAEQLTSMVRVQPLNGTQVMTLTAVDVSYERAAKIVNAVTEVFQSEIPKIMKVDNVAILHMAQMKENPIPMNKKTNQTLIISFAVSAMISIGLAFLLEFLDDTLKKEEEIAGLFGTTVLASIPRIRETHIQSHRLSQSNHKQEHAVRGKITNRAGEIVNAANK